MTERAAGEAAKGEAMTHEARKGDFLTRAWPSTVRTPRLNEKEFLADVLRPFHDVIIKALAPRRRHEAALAQPILPQSEPAWVESLSLNRALISAISSTKRCRVSPASGTPGRSSPSRRFDGLVAGLGGVCCEHGVTRGHRPPRRGKSQPITLNDQLPGLSGPRRACRRRSPSAGRPA